MKRLHRISVLYEICYLQRRKERGRIGTETIHTVEQALLGDVSKHIPSGDGDRSPKGYRYPFQVIHITFPLIFTTL